VVELAVPIAATRDSYAAASAVVATFGRSLGCAPEKKAFDLNTRTPLGPESLLAIHTESEPTFAMIGRGYPTRFVDVDIRRWKELTGEEG
jgi:hypothetical protein